MLCEHWYKVKIYKTTLHIFKDTSIKTQDTVMSMSWVLNALNHDLELYSCVKIQDHGYVHQGEKTVISEKFYFLSWVGIDRSLFHYFHHLSYWNI